jgi:hypothetical protein
MDYEIFLNHTVPDKTWDVYLQENHINATRGIIKTAMAYALTEHETFNANNVRIDTGGGRAGYVLDPDPVTDTDANGSGRLPGPKADGFGQNGQPAPQAPYSVTNQQWFRDENRYMPQGFVKLTSGNVGASAKNLNVVDTLVLADKALPRDPTDRVVDPARYYANLRTWVEKGGNLVLTDKAIHALESMGVVPDGSVSDIKVYQPYANIKDFENPMVEGLRSNARQLVEAAVLGYGIGNTASPMTIVKSDAWTAAGGQIAGTTGDGAGTTDDGTRVSVGQIKLGEGEIRIIGGALPTPTEANDHRFGLRDYAPTTSGLFILENSLNHNSPVLGNTLK